MNRFPFGLTGLLCATMIFGVAGDLSLGRTPWGINFTLWAGAILAITLWNARNASTVAGWPQRLPLTAALLFAMLFVWRDAAPMKTLLICVILVSLALASATALGRLLRQAFVWDYVLDGVNFVASAAVVPISMVGRAQQAARERGSEVSPIIFGILRGLLIATPLLFLLGALLIAADGLFERFVGDLLDPARIASHAFWCVLCGWIAATTWCLCSDPGIGSRVERSVAERPFRWGAIEVNVALGSVTLLFAVFIAVQAQYFLDPEKMVSPNASIQTLSQYARRGFFQLACVATITLITLVHFARVMIGAGPAGKRTFKVISGLLTIGILLVIASAFHRMLMYINLGGLTRLRVYTSLFMGWMVVVFLWLYVTILFERIRNFACGFLVSGYLATFVVIALNPDRLIARVNLRQMNGPVYSIDTVYIETLSADAIPMVIQRLPYLRPNEQSALKYWLDQQADMLALRQSRTLTYGLHRAQRALEKFESDPDPFKP